MLFNAYPKKVVKVFFYYVFVKMYLNRKGALFLSSSGLLTTYWYTRLRGQFFKKTNNRVLFVVVVCLLLKLLFFNPGLLTLYDRPPITAGSPAKTAA